jgi:hypothetical protein
MLKQLPAPNGPGLRRKTEDANFGAYADKHLAVANWWHHRLDALLSLV